MKLSSTQTETGQTQELNVSAGSPSSFKNFLRSLVPGIIIAAMIFGPSKITITTMLGAYYDYSLLWIVVVAIFFMIVFMNMSARIGIATSKSLLTTMSEKWGRPIGIAIGIGIFLVAASFQAGNSIGVGISLAEPTNTPMYIWIIIFNLLAVSFLFFKSFYKVLSKIMVGLVFLMLFAFITTLVLAKPSISGVIGGFVPSVPTGSAGLIIAFIASCFSIVGAFYQSYLVQERRRLSPGVSQTGKESFTGMLILGLMSAILMICSAVVLHPKGVAIESATDMAKALEPAFGKYAAYLFLAGLFGASFSALIGNATIGGSLLGDAFGFGGNLSSKTGRMLIALVMFIGAVMAIAFGKLPIQLIVVAQAVTIFIVPFIGIAMFLVANDRKLMGEYRNRTFSNIAGVVGLLLIIFLALNNAKTLFFN